MHFLLLYFIAFLINIWTVAAASQREGRIVNSAENVSNVAPVNGEENHDAHDVPAIEGERESGPPSVFEQLFGTEFKPFEDPVVKDMDVDDLPSLSSDSAVSDDEDIFNVKPIPAEKLPRDYSNEKKGCFLFRWQRAIAALTAQLRDDVLAPIQTDQISPLNIDSGAPLPLWHCAFDGCPVHSRETGVPGSYDENSYENALWEHLRTSHIFSLSSIVKDFSLKEGDMEHRTVLLTLYNAALAEKERKSVPKLGCTTDRRTLAHVSEVFNDDTVKVLPKGLLNILRFYLPCI